MDRARQESEEKARKRRRTAIAIYRTQGRARWLWSLFRTPSEMALATVSSGVVAAAGAWTAIDRYEVLALKREPAAQVEIARETPNSTVFEIIGFDKQGRRGVFDVVVLKKQFMWAHASDTEVERDEGRMPVEKLKEEAFDAEVRGALAEALEVLGVGTASQEGVPEREVERAGRRAEKAAKIAESSTLDTVPVWTLNLGQYREPCQNCETDGTSWQRPFIVVAVKELEGNADLGQSLADAMKGRERLPSPESYSAFELRKLR